MHERYKIHDKSSRDLYSKHRTLFDGLLGHAQKVLNYDRPVKIYLLDDEKNSEKSLGKTGYYNPDEDSIGIYATNRHIKDILRSLAHELVHHKQNCEGGFDHTTDTKLGYAQEDEGLRDKEEEAYKLGNLKVFRDFEDNHKRENPTMQEQRLRILNERITKKLLGDLITEKTGVKWRSFQKDDEGEEEEEGAEPAEIGTGATIVGTYATTSFATKVWRLARGTKIGAKIEGEAIANASKMAGDVLRKNGFPPQLVASIEKKMAEAGVNAGEQARPGRMRALMSKSKEAMRWGLRNGGKAGKFATDAIRSYAGNIAMQQRYFGTGSKFIVDKTTGQLIKKMSTKQIALLATEKGERAFEKAFHRSLKQRAKTALKTSVSAAQKLGKDTLARELVKQNPAMKKAEAEMLKQSKKVTELKAALTKLQGSKFPGEIKLKRAALKLADARRLENVATRKLKAVTRKSLAMAEKEALKQIEKEAIKKGLSPAAKRAAIEGAKASAEKTAARVVAKKTAEMSARGGALVGGGAAVQAKKMAAKGAGSAVAQLTGQAGAGVALGAALNVLSAAEFGYYVGKGINAFVLSQSETEEQEDRIKKGRSDVGYAVNELRVYFGMSSPLCDNMGNTTCLEPRAPGGYNYETVSSEESWASSFFGLDYGGRNKDMSKLAFTGAGGVMESVLGRFVQVPSFSSKDTLVIIGLMGAVVEADRKSKQIELITEEINKKTGAMETLDEPYFKIHDGALVKKNNFVDKFPAYIKATEGTAAFTKVFNNSVALNALSTIITALGWKKMTTEEGEDATGSKRIEVFNAVDRIYKAISGSGTDVAVVWGYLAGINKDGMPYPPEHYKGRAWKEDELPEFVKRVEKEFNKKYPKEGGLREFIDSDMDGSELETALKYFEPINGTVDQKLGYVSEKGFGKKAYNEKTLATAANYYLSGLKGWGTEDMPLNAAYKMVMDHGIKFARALESYWMTAPKFKDFDDDGLRDAIMDDLSGSEEKQHIAPFVAADRIFGAPFDPGNPGDWKAITKLGPKAAAAAAAGTGAAPGEGKKCDRLPISPGCAGKMPAMIYKIFYKVQPEGYNVVRGDIKNVYDEKLQGFINKLQKDRNIMADATVAPGSETDKALSAMYNEWKSGGGGELEEKKSLQEQRLHKLNRLLMGTR